MRLAELYVNEYRQERDAGVVLVLGTLANVGAPSLNTVDLAVRAAASLAWAYMRRKDRVGLIEYGGAFRWRKPGVPGLLGFMMIGIPLYIAPTGPAVWLRHP